MREEDIIVEIVSIFENLYLKESNSEFGLDGIDWSPISRGKSNWLERLFQEDEIKYALGECEGDKAPGPDGFTMALIKDCWDVIKLDILKVFDEFFENGG